MQGWKRDACADSSSAFFLPLDVHLPFIRPCSAVRHVGRHLRQSLKVGTAIVSCELKYAALACYRRPPSPSHRDSEASRRVPPLLTLVDSALPPGLERALATANMSTVYSSYPAAFLSRSTSSGRSRRSGSLSPSATSAWTRPASGSGAGEAGPTAGCPASSLMRRCVDLLQ